MILLSYDCCVLYIVGYMLKVTYLFLLLAHNVERLVSICFALVYWYTVLDMVRYVVSSLLRFHFLDIIGFIFCQQNCKIYKEHNGLSVVSYLELVC